MKKLLRRAAVAATSLGLSFGWAGVAAAQTADMGDTGPDSTNVISCNVNETYTLSNSNSVAAATYNTQGSHTGEADVRNNTNGGDASSGAASNSSSANTSVSVSNSGSSAAAFNSGGSGGGVATLDASMTDTGPDSYNKIESEVNREVHVDNTNNVSVSSTNSQTATSGEAEVENNTNAGSATTGGASNTSTQSTSISVSN